MAGTRRRSGRRKATYRKKSGVFATPGGMSIPAYGSTRSSVLKAAEILAAQARRNAAAFSTRIPAATVVAGLAEQQAAVVTDGAAAPNAAPFEFGERHPLFGDKKHWYKQPLRAYMNRAATNSGALASALEAYGAEETLLLSAEYGFDE